MSCLTYLPNSYNNNYEEEILNRRLASPTDITVIFFRTKIFIKNVILKILSYLWKEHISSITEGEINSVWEKHIRPREEMVDSLYADTYPDESIFDEAGWDNIYKHRKLPVYFYEINMFNGRIHTPLNKVQKICYIPMGRINAGGVARLQAYHMGTLFFETKTTNYRRHLHKTRKNIMLAKMERRMSRSYNKDEDTRKRMMRKYHRLQETCYSRLRKRGTELAFYTERESMHLIHMRALRLVRSTPKIWDGITNKTSNTWMKNDYCHRIQKFKILM